MNIIDKYFRKKSAISKYKLKDFFLIVNKEDVIEFAFRHINEDNYFEAINGIIMPNGEYNSPISNKEYLEKKYDYFLEFCKRDYEHELSINYTISTYNGFPFGAGEFIDIRKTSTGTGGFYDFFKENSEGAALPLEIILNCNIENCKSLLSSPTETVALFILQAVFIEEINNQC